MNRKAVERGLITNTTEVLTNMFVTESERIPEAGGEPGTCPVEAVTADQYPRSEVRCSTIKCVW